MWWNDGQGSLQPNSQTAKQPNSQPTKQTRNTNTMAHVLHPKLNLIHCYLTEIKDEPERMSNNAQQI
jgi:hypothetical protein